MVRHKSCRKSGNHATLSTQIFFSLQSSFYYTDNDCRWKILTATPYHYSVYVTLWKLRFMWTFSHYFYKIFLKHNIFTNDKVIRYCSFIQHKYLRPDTHFTEGKVILTSYTSSVSGTAWRFVLGSAVSRVTRLLREQSTTTSRPLQAPVEAVVSVQKFHWELSLFKALGWRRDMIYFRVC